MTLTNVPLTGQVFYSHGGAKKFVVLFYNEQYHLYQFNKAFSHVGCDYRVEDLLNRYIYFFDETAQYPDIQDKPVLIFEEGETYGVGTKFKNINDTYILVRVEGTKFNLFCIEDGSRWNGGFVSTKESFTLQELKQLTGDKDWVVVE